MCELPLKRDVATHTAHQYFFEKIFQWHHLNMFLRNMHIVIESIASNIHHLLYFLCKIDWGWPDERTTLVLAPPFCVLCVCVSKV